MKVFGIKNVFALLLVFVMLFSVASCKTTNTKKVSSADNSSGEESAVSSSDSASMSGDTSSLTTSSGAVSKSATKTSSKTTSKTVIQEKIDIIDPDPGIIEVKDNPKLVENITNLGGQTFKIGTFWINDWKAENSDITAVKNVAAIKKIEKDYNCKIQMVAMDPNFYLKNVAAATAAGKIYANIYESQMEMSKLAKNGYFKDLQGVKSIGLTTNEWYKPITMGATIKNGIYGVGVKQDYVSRTCVFFNRSLMAKYQLGDLFEIVNTNKWTTAKFLELSEAVYKKSNGTVQGANSVFQPYLLNTIYGNNTSPVVLKNGYPTFNGTDSKVISQLDFLQKYVQKGLYAKNKSSDYPTSINWFMQQKVLFYFGDLWMRSDMNTLMPKGIDWGIVPVPMGPDATNYTQIITNSRYLSLSSSGDCETSGKLLVSLAKLTNFTKNEYNVQLAAKLQNNDTGSLKVINNLMTYRPRYFQYNNAFQAKAMECVIDNKYTPKQAMESIIKSAQAEIDSEYTN